MLVFKFFIVYLDNLSRNCMLELTNDFNATPALFQNSAQGIHKIIKTNIFFEQIFILANLYLYMFRSQ